MHPLFGPVHRDCEIMALKAFGLLSGSLQLALIYQPVIKHVVERNKPPRSLIHKISALLYVISDVIGTI